MSSITVGYTDLYLKRSSTYLQKYLRPDTVLFLGDLFDGGREWSTPKSSSPDKQYRGYGDSFWAREYRRFGKIFIDRFASGGGFPASARSPARKLIASLPGNHDLGFASGIQIPVKKRFEAYFGPTNRVDILGNHTFVSVDTVSLSAMDQADPSTGSSGHGDGTSTLSPPLSEIWAPTEEFLKDVKETRDRLIEGEMRVMTDSPVRSHFHPETETQRFVSRLDDIEDSPIQKRMPSVNPSISSSHFPTILLTHVPLYRPPESDCGLLRERGNAISISAGYQYQNVLTPSISREIIDKIGPAESVAHIYSGDDHDYCDWSHTEFTGGILETTVKSMSLAMGVRKPGFLSVSLWNPINLSSSSANPQPPAKTTLQQNLCLLPDALAIIIRYAILLTITLILIFAETIRQRLRRLPDLPTIELDDCPNGHFKKSSHDLPYHRTSRPKASSLSSYNYDHNVAVRPNKRLNDYGNLPPSSRESSPSKGLHLREESKYQVTDDWGMPRARRRRQPLLTELGWNVWGVAWPVLGWWGWLIWTS